MPAPMHDDELPVDAALVRRLLAAQFPQWAGLPCTRVASSGTESALFRLGEGLVARLPRAAWAAGGVAKDVRWLPWLAPQLPVELPRPLALGRPSGEFPWEWGVYTWLAGSNPGLGAADAGDALADDALRLVEALRRLPLPQGAPRGRGPLEARDEATRAAIAALAGELDADAATAAWEEALRVPARPRWIHGDLLPANLLVRGGRLTGVVDWQATGVGDGACDLLLAWGLLTRHARGAFHAALGVDEPERVRGRGWALSVGLVALPYYRDTNPGMTAAAQHLIGEALADAAGA